MFPLSEGTVVFFCTTDSWLEGYSPQPFDSLGCLWLVWVCVISLEPLISFLVAEGEGLKGGWEAKLDIPPGWAWFF